MPENHRLEDLPIAAIALRDNHRLPEDAAGKKALEEMAARMRESGQLTPVRVRELPPEDPHSANGQKYVLVYGRRRLAAALMQNPPWKTIRAEVFPAASDEVMEIEAALENLDRADLNPIEEALIVLRMLALTGGSREETAARLGRGVKWVADRGYLARLDPKVQGLVATGTLPLGHARIIATVGDPKDQVEVAGRVTHLPWGWEKGRTEKLKDFAGRSRDGRVDLESLEATRQYVAACTRSLRLVPWQLDKPITNGKFRAPGCVGCPHNSATDAALFDNLDPAGKAEQGCCLNQSCFEAKMIACEKAKGEVLKAVAKSEAAVAMPELRGVAAKVLPALKPESAMRFVKKELERKEPRQQAGEARTPTGRAVTTDQERRHQALVKFDDAYTRWEEELGEAICKAARRRPVDFAGLVALGMMEAIAGDYYEPLPAKDLWDRRSTRQAPDPAPEASALALKLVADAASGDPARVVGMYAQKVADDESWSIHGWLPGVLFRYAQALKLKPAPSPPPEWANFLPPDLRPPQPTGKAQAPKGAPAKAAPAAVVSPPAESPGATETDGAGRELVRYFVPLKRLTPGGDINLALDTTVFMAGKVQRTFNHLGALYAAWGSSGGDRPEIYAYRLERLSEHKGSLAATADDFRDLPPGHSAGWRIKVRGQKQPWVVQNMNYVFSPEPQ